MIHRISFPIIFQSRKGDVILREVEVAIVEAGSIESLVLSAGEFASVSPIREYYFKFVIIIIIILV